MIKLLCDVCESEHQVSYCIGGALCDKCHVTFHKLSDEPLTTLSRSADRIIKATLTAMKAQPTADNVVPIK